MLKALPVPYLQINVNGEIQELSPKSREYFDTGVNQIQDCFDEESIGKLTPFLTPFEGEKQLEANVNSKNNPLLLCDIHISWDNNLAHIIFIPKDKQFTVLEEKLTELRLRIASTDFELYGKKEALEVALNKLNELSGPFIPISNKAALVPLFGDITELKLKTVSQHILKFTFDGQYDDIYFDFTATGEIDEGGMKKLSDLFQMLHYMNGKPVSIIGVKPNHVKQFHLHKVNWPVHFETSLKDVLIKNE